MCRALGFRARLFDGVNVSKPIVRKHELVAQVEKMLKVSIPSLNNANKGDLEVLVARVGLLEEFGLEAFATSNDVEEVSIIQDIPFPPNKVR